MTQTPFTSFGSLVRVEPGPARKVARATPALLDDAVTAPHYREGARDAAGRRIAIGRDMTFLDWQGDHGFYVYLLTFNDETGEERWIEDSFHPEEADATARAEALRASLEV